MTEGNNAAKSIAETCLLAIWQTSLLPLVVRLHFVPVQVAEPAPFCGELNSGLITELGNLDNDDRLRKATAYGLPSVLLRGRWQSKGKAQWEQPRGRIPRHCIRGGSARSSVEIPERRSPHEYL